MARVASTPCAVALPRCWRNVALAILLVLGARELRHLPLWAGRSPSPPPPLPPRDVDATTSSGALANRSRCPLQPPIPRLSLRWLPTGKAAIGVVPFLLLHEAHVGEAWLGQMLQASGAMLFVPKDRGKVRDAARAWLTELNRATRTRGGNVTAIGLALTPPALRILNHGIGGASKLSHLAPLRVITLSRRNRLKHALSRLSRQRPAVVNGTSVAGLGVHAPPATLLPLLASGERTFGELRCTAEQVATRLEQQAAGSHSAAFHHVDYEELLYGVQRALKQLRALLVLPEPLRGVANGPAFVTTKRTPNSLCVALVNYHEVCTALMDTPWKSDLGPPARGPKPCVCAGNAVEGKVRNGAAGWVSAAALVLAGSHHKTGTVLLERVMQLYAAEARVPFEKPSFETCASLQRREAGVCFDEHVSGAKLKFWWSPVVSAAAAFRAPLIHIVREPSEVCVSSYQYHLTSTEEWLRQ